MFVTLIPNSMPETEMLALGAEIKRLTELKLAHLKERDNIRIRRSQYYDQVTGIDGYDEQKINGPAQNAAESVNGGLTG